ncbi:MAG: hypothetical protein WEB57_00995 [Pseudohongiellaceae bacterium]
MPDFMRWRQQLQVLTGRHRGGGATPSLSADHVLLVTDEGLYDVTGGDAVKGTGEALAGNEGVSLAGAAARLVRRQEVPGQPAILLLLPPGFCVATTVTLPGVAPEAVSAALRLQASTLLPGHDGDLDLAVNPGRDPDALSEVALWMPRERLEGLFRAFQDEGLFLSAVMPRTVALAAAQDEAHVLDTNREKQTLLHWKDGAIRSWQQVSHRDLQQPEFAEQWRALCDAVPSGQLLEWPHGTVETRLIISRLPPAYRFQPQGAQQLARRQRNRTRYVMAAAAAASVVVLAALPFLWQSLQMVMLESRLADARQAATEARDNQAEVRAFEAEWGLLTEFPEQQAGEMMIGLQEVINPNVLGALELQEGYVNIEGQSEDPQRLLQELEEHPLFTEVDFASATSNNRYSIDLRLTTVDFGAYYDWYFPEQR